MITDKIDPKDQEKIELCIALMHSVAGLTTISKERRYELIRVILESILDIEIGEYEDANENRND